MPKVLELELGPVNALSSLDVITGLQAAAEAKQPVHMTINSPGGSVTTMFEIIELMRDLTRQDLPVTCTVKGMAASAAAIILEAGCSTREMTADSQLLFHEPSSGGGGGKEGDFRRAADELADMNQRVASLIAWRLGMTADEYAAWIRDRDRWLDAPGALKMGAVDKVLPPVR